jgi:hypothetical protein
MEWMNRAGRPNQNPGQTVAPNTNNSAASAGVAHHGAASSSRRKRGGNYFSFHNVTSVVLLFSLTLLTLAVIGLIMMYRQSDEHRYVAKDKMQAVFLNGGQVYFGKIRELNNKYVGVTDIYYLRVNQQVQPKEGEQAQQDISLVKLGCELHGPTDQMLINRDQVVFWENLKTDGQVAKAVEEYKKANPNGQDCNAQQKQNTNSGNSNNNNQQQNNGQNQSTTPTTP